MFFLSVWSTLRIVAILFEDFWLPALMKPDFMSPVYSKELPPPNRRHPVLGAQVTASSPNVARNTKSWCHRFWIWDSGRTPSRASRLIYFLPGGFWNVESLHLASGVTRTRWYIKYWFGGEVEAGHKYSQVSLRGWPHRERLVPTRQP